MLTKIKLGNFKSWHELDLDLAPVTILFGTNSSGKTNILQALLMLKQTAMSFDRSQHINFGGTERDYVDLGSYRELVYSHDSSGLIDIDLTWLQRRYLELFRDHEPASIIINRFNYSARWRYFDDEISLENLNYECYSEDQQIFFSRLRLDSLSEEDRIDDSYIYDAKYRSIYVAQFKDDSQGNYTQEDQYISIGSIGSCYYDNSRGADYYTYGTDRRSFNDEFEELINRIDYLGPLREHPERAYLWTGASPQEIGSRGENTIGMLIASQRSASNGNSLAKNVSEWLVKLGLVQELQVEAIDQGRRFYEPRVRIADAEIASALIDVGFGVSQVLPVITMLLSAPEGSIILLEQPELHLHPRAQAELADLFLDVAEHRNLQLIIESHSEHLLRRLQRRMAETEQTYATPDNIKMYFCQPGANGSTIDQVEVDEYGQIHNWPEHFFGDVAGDLDAMTDAAISRRRQELAGG